MTRSHNPRSVARLPAVRGALDPGRRRFVTTLAAGGALTALHGLLPAYGRTSAGLIEQPGTRRPGTPIDLHIGRTDVEIDGRRATAVTINGTVPGPLLRFTEGEDAVIHVHNELDEDTSVHWHGLILPFEMDGVPGVSYPGIAARSTFTYRFPIRQHGTYWYHSHTGLQEQLGHYGPIVIDPADDASRAWDREHVIVLSDWTFEDPWKVLAKLKKLSSYYNYQRRTAGDLLRDVAARGLGPTLSERAAWSRMRMDPTDIADITGFTYTYLVNGRDPASNWTGLFGPGERVRLRIINAATMTYFNVRIPGLPMTVVQADGQDVAPVDVDELQIAVAETYDVIVRPDTARAYTVFAESMDRSGYARGTLAPEPGMTAPVPALRPRPLRTMVDMGMDMNMSAGGGMDMGSRMAASPGTTMDGGSRRAMSAVAEHGEHATGRDRAGTAAVVPGADRGCVPGLTPCPSPVVARHDGDGHGPGNTTVASVQRNRLGEPGTGLAQVGHRVLVYTDLRRAADDFDARAVDRELELHVTGNMERYMWSFDGRKFTEVKGPVEFRYGERLRLVLVNDTMMEHPIHLHGMWLELENGHGSRIPRKHTISVKPAERLSALVAVDAPGRWAFHCHLLYHMDMGMFRVVQVT